MPFIVTEGFAPEHNPEKLGPILNSVVYKSPPIYPYLPNFKNAEVHTALQPIKVVNENEKIEYNPTFGANMKNFYVPL